MKVFVSSTYLDNAERRRIVEDAVLRASMVTVGMERFTASAQPTVEECERLAAECEIYVGIVAYRYGWIPHGHDRSITEIEYDAAGTKGRPRLMFQIDDSVQLDPRVDFDDGPDRWPKQQKLDVFKARYAADQMPARFTDTTLGAAVLDALTAIRARLADGVERAPAARNPQRYLRDLRHDCGYFDIRGLATGAERAHRIPVESLYVELRTSGGGDRDGPPPGRKSDLDPDAAMRSHELREMLNRHRLVVIGDPGAGKSTFLNWVAYVLAGDRLELTREGFRERLGLDRARVPLRVPVNAWIQHVEGAVAQNLSPRPPVEDDPDWLPHYLGDRAARANQGLDADWFRRRLREGDALVLIDGLDEAPDRPRREAAVRRIVAAAAAYEDCPFVVTTRPVAYRDRAVLPGFEPVRIAPLDDEAIARFLTLWSEALHGGDTPGARAERDALLAALATRPDIRRMARTSVMLTALAVLHWNEKRLPEQRADLYESVLGWLARSREQRPGRASAEQCLARLRRLALAMQCNPNGRQVEIGRRAAAEALAPEFFGADVDQAEAFLAEEELDSGIVVARANRIRFWHLSFQEYLAARALGGLSDERQHEHLLGPGRALYAPEWREVALLFAGVLHAQGPEKVDGLVTEMLDDLDTRPHPGLADSARTFGLAGAIARDLAPVGYTVADDRYPRLLGEVMAIFDREGARQVPVDDRIAAAEALAGNDPRLTLEHPERWVEVPEGELLMGAQNRNDGAPGYDADADDDESPPHSVWLDAFHMARFPVTVAEYRLFVEDEGYARPEWWTAGGFSESTEPDEWDAQVGTLNRPVVGVSWFEANAFCAWLTAHARERRLSWPAPGRIVRLPTEAQWEWAARRDTGRRYPWGDADASPERLNYELNVGRATPVGVYPAGATPDGILDLAGNVLEWCHDWFTADYYKRCASSGLTTNPTGPMEGSVRVLRGGAWCHDSRLARAAYRYYNAPYARSGDIGFRVVCSSPILDSEV